MVGRSKLESATARLGDLNPHVRVVPHAVRLSSANARAIIAQYDVVVDGSDNFPTRYLVNDVCVLERRPLVYGSIFRFDGQASVFDATRGPCYRCLYPEPPPPGLVPSCAEGGVLGVLPGIIGSIQALEAIKLVLGIGEPLVGRLVLVDALRFRIRELTLRKDPACPVCGTSPSVTELIDYEAFCGMPPLPDAETEVDAATLARELGGSGRPLLLDVREPHEWEIAHVAGATLIPLGELPARLAEIDPHVPIVTYCHRGVRSQRAREILVGAGYRGVRSLAGGIDAWAREVEPGMARY
jgi:rhodanese-related sulfurtransferase